MELEKVIEELNKKINRLNIDEAKEILKKNPFKKELESVYEWKNYVPTFYRDNWEKLSEDCKIAIYVLCTNQAQSEHWDW